MLLLLLGRSCLLPLALRRLLCSKGGSLLVRRLLCLLLLQSGCLGLRLSLPGSCGCGRLLLLLLLCSQGGRLLLLGSKGGCLLLLLYKQCSLLLLLLSGQRGCLLRLRLLRLSLGSGRSKHSRLSRLCRQDACR